MRKRVPLRFWHGGRCPAYGNNYGYEADGSSTPDSTDQLPISRERGVPPSKRLHASANEPLCPCDPSTTLGDELSWMCEMMMSADIVNKELHPQSRFSDAVNRLVVWAVPVRGS